LQLIVPPGGPDAQEDLYDIEISDILAADNMAKYLAAGVDGTMELSNYDAADVNRDGAVNVVDVQATVNIILGITPQAYPDQGDVNGDGNVNVVDVQMIVNCILNPANCP